MVNDLTCQRFGRLIAVKDIGSRRKLRHWLCRCDCGNDVEVASNHLRSGHTQSCGCFKLDRQREAWGKTGAHTRIHRIWKNMLTRCRYPRAVNWQHYGGRGISVCAEWHDFETFRDWALANGYRDDLTIDRENNDGNYEPSNCRWATRHEQRINQRKPS